MEVLILGWYVLVTTGSVFWLSAIAAMSYGGTLLAPVFGVVGDRISHRNLLCLMRATYTMLAATLTFLFITEQATLPLVFAIAGMLGLVRPSDIGVRGALVAHTISPDQLNGAVALSRTTADSARIVGALTGAGLFAAFGIAAAYMLVTSCYLVGFLMTLAVSIPTKRASSTPRSPFRDLAEGVRYVWNTPHIQAGMWLACLVNFSAFPLSMGLMPYVAKNIYGLDQNGLGMLIACFAIGSFVGSVALAIMRNSVRAGQLMLVTSVLWHAMLFAFAFTTDVRVGLALLVVAGFMQSLSMVSLAFMLLRTSEPYIRGRVMGVRMLAIYSLPIGLLLAGTLIPKIGYVATAASYAGAGILLTILIAIKWRKSVWLPSGAANA
ncbi:MAG: putative MFS family arabinose efflux permease [Hyphomicrobiaceae bacterium]|jgi:predicted MFS family arabinose efflux permease